MELKQEYKRVGEIIIEAALERYRDIKSVEETEQISAHYVRRLANVAYPGTDAMELAAQCATLHQERYSVEASLWLVPYVFQGTVPECCGMRAARIVLEHGLGVPMELYSSFTEHQQAGLHKLKTVVEDVKGIYLSDLELTILKDTVPHFEDLLDVVKMKAREAGEALVGDRMYMN